MLPLLPSCCSFSFVLECGKSFFFFCGFQHPPVDGCSANSCNFGVLAEDEHTSFYSAIFHGSTTKGSILFFVIWIMAGRLFATESPGKPRNVCKYYQMIPVRPYCPPHALLRITDPYIKACRSCRFLHFQETKVHIYHDIQVS